MSVSQAVLFACSRCFSRHPFEELSSGHQLCKECRGTYPVVKCTYCRSEFQQMSRSSTVTICKKCEYNVKNHGKPTACEYCNIIAAFGSSKCQRCTHSEFKYGPAVTCDQCRQRCAFDRHDENKKVDGKLMCWLCTLSYKRAVAKARQSSDVDHHHHSHHQQQQHSGSHHNRMAAKKRPSTDHQPKDGANGMQLNSKRSMHMSSSTSSAGIRSGSGGNDAGNSTKTGSGGDHSAASTMMRSTASSSSSMATATTTTATMASASAPVDHNSSEHMVALTQLREQIAGLNKKVMGKDRELLAKDKHITELKSKNFVSENELRTKMKDTEKYYETKIEVLNKKVAGLLKEVAQLSKGTKRGGAAAVASAAGGHAANGGGGQGNGGGQGGNSVSGNGGGGGGLTVAALAAANSMSSSSAVSSSAAASASSSSSAASSSDKGSGGSVTDSPNTN